MIIDGPIVVDAALAWIESPVVREMLGRDRDRLELIANMLIARAGVARELHGPAAIVALLALAETLNTMIAQAYLLRRPT